MTYEYRYIKGYDYMSILFKNTYVIKSIKGYDYICILFKNINVIISLKGYDYIGIPLHKRIAWDIKQIKFNNISNYSYK